MLTIEKLFYMINTQAEGSLSVSDVIGLVGNIVGLILALFAIWLSFQFYNQAKGSESRVETALTAIKTQTEALEKLSGKQLDKLTKFVTTPRDDMQMIKVLQSSFSDLQNKITASLPPQVPNNTLTREDYHQLYLILWNYVGRVNLLAGLMLPLPSDFNERNINHRIAKEEADLSYADFQRIEEIFKTIPQVEIDSLPQLSRDLYNLAQTFKLAVGDTAQQFAKMSQMP